MRLAALLAAAGEASRFGGVKQLALIDGVPMLSHALQALSGLEDMDVFVVLGAHRNALRPLMEDRAQIIEHEGWRDGLGSSIAAGVAGIVADGDYDGILIALADQPGLTTADYATLIEPFDGTRIIASSAGGRLGAPALFPASSFHQLQALSGDQGARGLIRDNSSEVLGVAMEKAARDVDRPGDLEKVK